jgi:uncharacterized protein YbjT (DUF2867 family)
MAEQTGKTALLAGASGLVGEHLLPLLLDAGEYTRVYALSRRPLPLDHPRLANRVVRFEVGLEAQISALHCNDVYCCLGTTMRDAGSEAAFRAVDHDLVLQLARAAQAAGAERLAVVSAAGASDSSRNFYLRVKGETERALEALRFPALDIMQPSLLFGARRNMRPLELLAQIALWCVNPLILGSWTRYRGIAAGTVAAAMLGAVRTGRRGVNRYTYREMRALAHPAPGRSA